MTPSTMAGVALPVWIEANSWRVWSRAFFILALASVRRGWDMGFWGLENGSAVDQGPDFLSSDPSQNRVLLVQVEDQDGDVVIKAKREGGRIHDLQALLQRVDEGDFVVFDRIVV